MASPDRGLNQYARTFSPSILPNQTDTGSPYGVYAIR